MKKILIKICMAFICFLGVTSSHCQPVYPLTGHPRLFFLSADEAILKSKLSSNATLYKVHNVIIDECNKMLNLPYQQRVVTGGTMITISREAFRRIGFLCYAYRMTGDTRYAARAESEMLSMAAFPDWNPSNQLDFTEMTMAMAIGYDWLYNYLGQNSRLTIANAIKQKGIEETIGTKANKYFLQDKREIYSNVNSIQVGNASISAGVAAVYDEDPAYYQPLIDRAINLIKFPMGVYQYNGAYPESVMYWEYGTTFNIFMIDLLQRMWNTDRDLLKMEGFLKTSNFALQMHGTATKRLSGENLNSFIQQVFNFGDGGSALFVFPAMFWLAAQAPEQGNLSVEMKKLDFALSSATWSLQSNRFLPFLLIWSRNLSLNNFLVPVENTYIAQGLSAVATLRTGWSNNDIFLAMKGGTSAASHSHMDAGSFVMDAMDVRWAMDFGGSSTLAISNLGHNTLTINGNNQLKSGYATVRNLIDTPAQKSVDIDMSSIYANDAVSCMRTGAIILNRYVEIKDVIQAGTVLLNVRWNLLTEAVPVKVSNRIFLLTQSTKKLYMIFQGASQVTAQTWSTNPDNLSVPPFPGTILAGFEFSIPPGATQTVTVKLVPEGDPALAELLLSTTASKFKPENQSITAYYDEPNHKICVTHLPASASRIRLFDTLGRLLQDVQVYGDFAMLEFKNSVSSVLIVQVIMADGSFQSVKMLP
jgi:oligo-alginate lyase